MEQQHIVTTCSVITMSPLHKLTTEHTEYTERVRVMNKFLTIGRMEEKCAQPIFNEG